MRVVLATAVAAVLTLGCAQPPPAVTSGPDVDAISQLREREFVAFTTADVAQMASIFTDDILTMPPNSPALHGLDALGAFAQGMLEAFTASGGYTGAEVTVVGDRAYETYTVTLVLTPRAGGPAMEERAKGIHVYERQGDGTWRIALDIWNSDLPPPPAGM